MHRRYRPLSAYLSIVTGTPLKQPTLTLRLTLIITLRKGKGSPYSITERVVPEVILVLGTQPACR